MKVPASFIRENFSAKDFLANCDEAFRLYGQGAATMPPREQNLDAAGQFTLKMSASVPGYSGYKFIEELPPDSKGKLGLRTAVIKLRPDDAEEVSMDAEYITNMRTGAAGALGLKYFAPQAKNITILGTGKISKALALCAAELGVQKINAYSRNLENREKFKNDFNEHSVFDKIVLCDSVISAIHNVDAILTAVPTPEPILFFKDLSNNVFISVMGGDSRTIQLDREILEKAVIVPDSEEQCKKSGEFKTALEGGYYDKINFAKYNNRLANIGDAALGKLGLKDGIKIAYFTGLAIQDIHAAMMVFEKHQLINSKKIV